MPIKLDMNRPQIHTLCMCAHMCASVNAHACAYEHTHIHPHVNTYTHTEMHTHKRVSVPVYRTPYIVRPVTTRLQSFKRPFVFVFCERCSHYRVSAMPTFRGSSGAVPEFVCSYANVYTCMRTYICMHVYTHLYLNVLATLSVPA